MVSFLESSPKKWHQGPEWERFFQVYDQVAKEQFSVDDGGESKQMDTSFGTTQIHVRGNPTNPPLIFFHGIASCSLMFGEWLIPKLSKDFYCIAMDTIGDIGRSCPKDHDPKNGPKTNQEVGDWAVEIFQALGLVTSSSANDRNDDDDDGNDDTSPQTITNITTTTGHKIHLVGYSMGSFLACCVAQSYPHLIHKVILMAPAGTVAPVNKLWLAKAIGFGIVSKFLPEDSYLAESLRLWFFGSMMADAPSSMNNFKYPELRKASDQVGMVQVQIQPIVFDIETLTQMTQKTPTMMIIGRQENVIHVDQAIDTAQKSKMKLIVYENAGHMFFCEHPREIVIDEIKDFLF